MSESLKEKLARVLLNESEAGGGGFDDMADAVLTIVNPALAEARAEGRRQGLEEAGEIIDAERAKWGWLGNQGLDQAQDALDRLRSLATAPAETQKPETGEIS